MRSIVVFVTTTTLAFSEVACIQGHVSPGAANPSPIEIEDKYVTDATRSATLGFYRAAKLCDAYALAAQDGRDRATSEHSWLAASEVVVGAFSAGFAVLAGVNANNASSNANQAASASSPQSVATSAQQASDSAIDARTYTWLSAGAALATAILVGFDQLWGPVKQAGDFTVLNAQVQQTVGTARQGVQQFYDAMDKSNADINAAIQILRTTAGGLAACQAQAVNLSISNEDLAAYVNRQQEPLLTFVAKEQLDTQVEALKKQAVDAISKAPTVEAKTKFVADLALYNDIKDLSVSDPCAAIAKLTEHVSSYRPPAMNCHAIAASKAELRKEIHEAAATPSTVPDPWALLGRVWSVTEGGVWIGTWTRQDATNVFVGDQRKSGTAEHLESKLRIDLAGQSRVTARRYEASDNNLCTFDGVLSGNQVSGKYMCGNTTAPLEWNATIEGLATRP